MVISDIAMLCLKCVISCIPYLEEAANFFPSALAGEERAENTSSATLTQGLPLPEGCAVGFHGDGDSLQQQIKSDLCIDI